MWERQGVISSAAGLLARVKRGEGGALFVLGEPGLGKSAVLDECVELAGSEVEVGLGRGDPMGTLLPFGLLGQTLEGLGAERLFEPTPAGDSGADRRASLYYAVLRWFDDRSRPLLCAIDDLHWADDDSLTLLSFLCRRLHRLPVALIGTLRAWPSAAHGLVERLVRSGAGDLEHLHPLSEGSARTMLEARAGRDLSPALHRQAWSLTAGNPLLLEQLALVITQGQDLPAVVPGSAGLADEMLLARFAGLPAGGMLLARAASVLGVRFRPDVATEVAQVAEGEADLYLEAMWRLALVRESSAPGLVEFVHPLFHQALYADLGAPLRSRLHARAFATLARRGMDEEAAHHAIQGGLAGNPDAIRVLEGVGSRALRQGAFGVAAEHLGAAVELNGDHARPELNLSLAEALLAGGRSWQAVPVLRGVLDRPDIPAAARVRALRTLGRSLFTAGEHRQASACFEEAATLAGAHHPDAAVQILLDHALSSWTTAGPAQSLPLAQRARELARGADDVMRRRAEAAWGFIAVQAGDAAGLEATAAAAEPVARDPLTHLEDLCWIWSPLHTFGLAAANVERYDRAEEVLRVALDASESAGAAEVVSSLRISYGLTLARRGRLDEALRMVESASELVDLVTMTEAYAGAGRAHILQLMGRLEESRRWCQEFEPIARARNEWVALLLLLDVKGHRRLREGRVSEAVETYAEMEAVSERLGIGEPCLVPWARHAISAYLAAGRPADALRVVEWLERCAAGLPCRWPRIVALTGRAGLEAAAGQLEAAEKMFEQAVRLHQGLELGIQEIETLLQYGTFLRRSGRIARSRQVLGDAARLAEACGAHWLGQVAEAELRAAGGRRRRRREPERLTPQEQRVAELAATGLSNKEIAQRLFLAVSTVETHLQQVYSKLSITSRRQLMTMELSEVGVSTPAKVPQSPGD